jgi:hypothetical protein
MPKLSAHGIRERGKMPETIKASTTDRNGNVFILVAVNPNFWSIKSSEKILFDGQCHRVVAVGQERYVRTKWKEFVDSEKRAIATNYDALARFNTQQAISRS